MFRYAIEGIQQAQRALANTNRSLDNALTKAQRNWAGGVVLGQLYGERNYVPQRSGSTYQRTGTLGRGWSWTAINRYQVSITNQVAYSVYVVGNDIGEGQAWMHKGRWWTAFARISSQLPKLHNMIGDALSNAVSEWH